MGARCSKCGAETDDNGDMHCRRIFTADLQRLIEAHDLERAKTLYFSAHFDGIWKQDYLARKAAPLHALIEQEAREAAAEENRKQQIAQTELHHQAFLDRRGIASKGATLASATRKRRTPWCYLCWTPLDNAIDLECNICGWIICCRDGACGCGRAQKELDTPNYTDF